MTLRPEKRKYKLLRPTSVLKGNDTYLITTLEANSVVHIDRFDVQCWLEPSWGYLRGAGRIDLKTCMIKLMADHTWTHEDVAMSLRLQIAEAQMDERIRREEILEEAQVNFTWRLTWYRTELKRLLDIEKKRRLRGLVPNTAQRRLHRELMKIRNDPSWGVSAVPVDDNILLWHCNVAAPGGLTGKGMLHLELEFPHTYPAYPPKVKPLGASIQHPNVFGEYICLDLLEQGEFEGAEEAMKPFTGWSAAYGVQAILIQLQSFFYSGAETMNSLRIKAREEGHEYRVAPIRIKPHTSDPTWEYQLRIDETGSFWDFEWDEFSACRHGKMTGCKVCGGPGRFTLAWHPMDRSDMVKLEVAYQRYLKRKEAEESDEALDPTYNLVDPVFARRIKVSKTTKQCYSITVVRAANLSPPHVSDREKHTAKVKAVTSDVRVEVHLLSDKMSKEFREASTARDSTDRSDIIKKWRKTPNSWSSGDAKHTTPYYEGDTTDPPYTYRHSGPVWNQRKVFQTRASDPPPREMLFIVYRNDVSIGECVLPVSKLATTSSLPIIPHKGFKKQGVLYIKGEVATLTPKSTPEFVVDFSPLGIEGNFTQRASHSMLTRLIRRRKGWECGVCSHKLAKPNPPLPAAIECDDAPPFALANMKQEILDSCPASMRVEFEQALGRADEDMQKRLIASGKAKKAPSILRLTSDMVLTIFEYLPRMRERRYMAQIIPSWEVQYKDARFWEAQHLRCFSTGAKPDDDVLGIPVAVKEVMNGRPVFGCQFDALSRTAYQEGTRYGVWKESFTHWMPLFINRDHAQRADPYFVPELRKLCRGVRSAHTAWTPCGAALEGKGKDYLRQLKDHAPDHVWKATGWAGLRGGGYYAMGKHFYQIQVLEYDEIPNIRLSGNRPALGSVKVGWVMQTGDMNLGCDQQGYSYSSGGTKSHGADREAYGPPINPGDIVGSLWNAEKRTIEYFLNGESLGVAFVVPKDKGGLIPALSLSRATVKVDIEDGFGPPEDVDTKTLGNHSRSHIAEDVANVLTVVPSLMNHLMVDVMKGDLFASLKALQGYCAIHRLLLHYCEMWPQVQECADALIETFINNPGERHKMNVPDLGVLLCLLTISQRFWWEDIRNSFLTELFARHVRWSIKKSRLFAASVALPDRADYTLLSQEAFRCNETSCKLVMFQVFFSQIVKPPKEDADLCGDDFFRYTKLAYDERMGFPTEEVAEELKSYTKKVDAILAGGWNGFLKAVGAGSISSEVMGQRIKMAVERSKVAGYHVDCSLPEGEAAERGLRWRFRPKGDKGGKGAKGKGGKGAKGGKGMKGGKRGRRRDLDDDDAMVGDYAAEAWEDKIDNDEARNSSNKRDWY
eukprot:Sspe_Gene.29991::Locus_14548_Transcript_1_1_Confidence_1.000_Length_4447::g.29991::m.29991